MSATLHISEIIGPSAGEAWSPTRCESSTPHQHSTDRVHLASPLKLLAALPGCFAEHKTNFS